MTPATPTSDPDTGAVRRDAAIDGWRAVAVACVIFAHAASFRFGDSTGTAGRWAARLSGPLAEFGVQIFFVLSGFIITTLLLREGERTGRISIAAFYARRCFRILPPLLIYYAAILLLDRVGYLTLGAADLLGAATFTCNTGLTDCGWWVAHTWSLAVEEQFYLGWPLLVALMPPRGGCARSVRSSRCCCWASHCGPRCSTTTSPRSVAWPAARCSPRGRRSDSGA